MTDRFPTIRYKPKLGCPPKIHITEIKRIEKLRKEIAENRDSDYDSDLSEDDEGEQVINETLAIHGNNFSIGNSEFGYPTYPHIPYQYTGLANKVRERTDHILRKRNFLKDPKSKDLAIIKIQDFLLTIKEIPAIKDYIINIGGGEECEHLSIQDLDKEDYCNIYKLLNADYKRRMRRLTLYISVLLKKLKNVSLFKVDECFLPTPIIQNAGTRKTRRSKTRRSKTRRSKTRRSKY
jgi:hypothetical protein